MAYAANRAVLDDLEQIRTSLEDAIDNLKDPADPRAAEWTLRIAESKLSRLIDLAMFDV